MTNFLLRHCRESAQLTRQHIRAKTGIPVTRYKQLEQSGILPEWSEVQLLGKLFNIPADYLYQYALQLESLRIARELVAMQKQMIAGSKTKTAK